MVDDSELCGAQYNIQQTPEKQYTFRSTSAKEKQLNFLLIDKRSRRYCTAAKAHDMTDLGNDHRMVTAHFRFPCVKKKGGLDNKDRNPNLCKQTRYSRQSASMEPREHPGASENTRKSSKYVQNLKKNWQA